VIEVAAPLKQGALFAVAAVAGALAVPLHILATPLSAAAFALLTATGLRVWRWSGLPACLTTTARGPLWRYMGPMMWLLLGLAIGLTLLALLRLVIEPSVPSIGARIAAAGLLPVWRRLAIIYVAAVGEELIFRLLLLSAVVGLGGRSSRLSRQPPSRRVIQAAIVIAALVFAASHLPAWTANLSLPLALSVMGLNAIAGWILGLVFVKSGITAAIWTHAGGDCAVQLIGPLVG
jgi:CAAX prenyl protease-like protein